MPAAAKSFWPALVGFVACSFTYTTVVARQEGRAMTGAMDRFEQQKLRGETALYGGSNLLEPIAK
ncbi:hypothetical protein BU24DRAFT_466732 [Aaosphaeria arxii CBS 175.79]|uniref:Uncharacterized protein n=1 Tax=Aaosphaeria arxii CBS 175.79 TaxID=1450172 RepID=A0A6A5XDV1_9PLEO|nr:uncharacterized protein BU24DRAFT_466732 [Aaosphaeria arxii CBS 175.79]KAF2010987.1 hypothetical protein BU24DRAFT_466732 [Aaosphaeria arxii CBS 175.79]